MKILRLYTIILLTLISSYNFAQGWILDNTATSGGLTIETYYNEQYNNEVVSCYGYTDGHHICPKCFHAYYFGVSVERKQWEKWNKTTWKKMFDKYGNT